MTLFNYHNVLQTAMRQHKTVYITMMILVFVSLMMLPRLVIDTDPENMLDADNPARSFHNQTKTNFAMKDAIVVGAIAKTDIFNVDDLSRLNVLSEHIMQIDGVISADVMAINTVDNISQLKDEWGNNMGIRFEYLMKVSPTTQAAAEQVKHAVKRLPLLENTLVSSDNKAIMIYVPIAAKSLSYSVAQNIRAFIKHHQLATDELAFHITGLPVAEDQFGVEMFVQMGISAPLAGLAIFVLLWYFFRHFPLIIAPMVVALATVIITMGSLIGLGFTVHIMSSMIAIFLMPIAVVDSVHILSEFADKYKKGDNVKETLTQVMEHLYQPMLFTSITSAVGFYSLMLTPIPPVKVFGAFIGSGILLAFLLTVLFIPVYISRMSEGQLDKLHRSVLRMEAKGILTSMLIKIGDVARHQRRLVLSLFSVFLVIGAVGISRIEINDNPVNWFKANHEIRVADNALNQHFAGTYDAWLVLEHQSLENTEAVTAFSQAYEQARTKGLNVPALDEVVSHYFNSASQRYAELFTPSLLGLLGDLSFSVDERHQEIVNQLTLITEQALDDKKIFIEPAMLAWIADLQSALLATDLVGKSNSLSDIVKTVNRELQSGDEQDYKLPNSRQGVAQTLLQYQSSHRPQDLWHFVTPDYQSALLWLQMTSGDNQHTSEVVAWVNQYISTHPAPINVDVNWAGKTYLNIVWQDAMVNGMMESLLSSFVIVFVMMMLLFRSFKYGVLAMLPLTFTIIMIYGLIGWVGKAYDMPIAVLSALTLGLSIDFAIHFLQRIRELLAQNHTISQAMVIMFEGPSRAISRNAIVIAVGFTPLLFSPLVPYITVGFFLASIMMLSALVTLILLPALLMIVEKPKVG